MVTESSLRTLNSVALRAKGQPPNKASASNRQCRLHWHYVSIHSLMLTVPYSARPPCGQIYSNNLAFHARLALPVKRLIWIALGH